MRCGIDFGTSNTTLSVLSNDGTPRLVALEGDAFTIPSALFFPVNGLPVFGRAAIAAYLSGVEGRFMRSLKRVLGTPVMQSGTIINGTRFKFDVVIGLFLRHIKSVAEKTTGTALTGVTLGRPVHFQDRDPDADARAESALRDIAAGIGFADVRFQYEPVAGALSHEASLTREQLALVIDIGGGTSDFSVIRLSPDHKPGRDRASDILANTGIRIGGNDCDKSVNLNTAMPLLGLGGTMSGGLGGEKTLAIPAGLYHDLSEWSKILFCYTPQVKQIVRQIARAAHDTEALHRLETVLDDELAHKILSLSEQAKIDLSLQETAHVNYDFLDDACGVTVTQTHVNALFDTLLSPVVTTMENCLAQAGVTADDIGALVLTGGSTALPFFQALWQSRFPHATLLDADRLGSVGLGLCLS